MFCDKKFELSTIFKSPEDMTTVRWHAAEQDISNVGSSDDTEVLG